MDILKTISSQASLRLNQVQAAVDLLEADNTLPFIARYRKEATGGLDEEQLRQVEELLDRFKALEERRATVLASIMEQGKLTPELEEQIQSAQTQTELEDLYLPYRPKRQTRASQARGRGLQPLADLILKQLRFVEELDLLAAPYLGQEVPDAAAAWQGAMDIVAETIADHSSVRQQVRQKAMTWGSLVSEKIQDAVDERQVYAMYYAFELRTDRLRPHQVLAINRGETEKVLRVKVLIPERDWRGAVQANFRSDAPSPLAGMLQQAVEDAAERLLLPAIERDVRRALFESAETHAIGVFASNLRALLGQPPLVGQTVLGIDPGFRTGCKAAVVDPTGKLLAVDTIYPHEPKKSWEAALERLQKLALVHGVTLISIGNGTASRETELLAAELIHRLSDQGVGLNYLITNEAGASVYSASKLARAELPELDVTLRGAVSIARRVQDPLAELVKIDPQSIGVGLYQHDVDQKRLADALKGVVESVVNHVGVDANTASPALLTYVAGIGEKLAEKIVAHREIHGPFRNRKALMEVSGLGKKAFEQAAGFLRIRGGENLLDSSAIHPESYKIAEAVLAAAGLGKDSIPSSRKEALEKLVAGEPLGILAARLGCGEPTLADILEQLVRPGRDPREDAPLPVLRADVLKMEDLVTGMQLKGTVRNVVDFGAFVDIGVKQDGLLHRSQIPVGSSLQVGDVILVEVLKVEIERGRIALGWHDLK